ncbi:S-layer homology domain-containing protein [Thermovenabulum gondwanense]|uniref:Surface layer protein n=1 Tax=Thermovenabulum gondwanense TaxID=520767 RepID=A0A162MWH9_9FIRM|nr:S-layer homology domain-containing protein [Thermovenabulum gondwanense]KYO68018.1 Surface layer protein [Thermovenabulum gondwanense]
MLKLRNIYRILVFFVIFIALLSYSKSSEAGDEKRKLYISRGEFAKLLVQAAFPEANSINGGNIIFRDLKMNSIHAPFILFLYHKGIIKGYPDGTVKPEKLITYPEALALILRTLGIKDLAGENANWEKSCVELSVKEGLIKSWTYNSERKILSQKDAEELVKNIFSENSYAKTTVMEALKNKNALENYKRRDVMDLVYIKGREELSFENELQTTLINKVFHQKMMTKAENGMIYNDGINGMEIYIDENYNYINLSDTANMGNNKWIRVNTSVKDFNIPVFIENFDFKEGFFILEDRPSEGVSRIKYYLPSIENNGLKDLEKIGILPSSILQSQKDFTVEKIQGELFIDENRNLLKEIFEIKIIINSTDSITLNGFNEYFNTGEEEQIIIPDEAKYAPYYIDMN